MRNCFLAFALIFTLVACKKSATQVVSPFSGSYIAYREVDTNYNSGNRGISDVEFTSLAGDTTYTFSYLFQIQMQVSQGTLPSIGSVTFTSGTTGYFNSAGVNTSFTYSAGQGEYEIFQETSGRWGTFMPQKNNTLLLSAQDGLYGTNVHYTYFKRN